MYKKDRQQKMELVIRMIRDSSSEQIMYKSTVESFLFDSGSDPNFHEGSQDVTRPWPESTDRGS